MNSTARSAEQLVLEGRTGPELAAALSLVAETEAGGEPKFAPGVCRKLNRIVVCRAYASALLELCHLITAASRCGPYEDFFWAGGPARAASFRSRLSQARLDPASMVSVGAREITLTYRDGSFAITYARMPLLSALMEFLVTALGYGALDEICDGLTRGQPTMAQVSGRGQGARQAALWLSQRAARQPARSAQAPCPDRVPHGAQRRRFHPRGDRRRGGAGALAGARPRSGGGRRLPHLQVRLPGLPAPAPGHGERPVRRGNRLCPADRLRPGGGRGRSGRSLSGGRDPERAGPIPWRAWPRRRSAGSSF